MLMIQKGGSMKMRSFSLLSARSFGVLASIVFGALLMQANVATAQVKMIEGLNEGATYVGQPTCQNCHSSEDAHYKNTTHWKMFTYPKNDLEAKTCEACHGPGSKHVEDATDRKALIGYTREWGTPVEVQQAQCLQCHKGGERINWQGSVHQINRLSCSDCHNPMAKFSQTGLLKKPSIIETCFTCHQEKRAEFARKSHMPLLEGKMTCDDCHNPHGSSSVGSSSSSRLLKGNTVAETCFDCHQEKRGPFLWEHPPVRQGDQCLNCHLPHGSNNQTLLNMPVPMLCNQCHDAGSPHDRDAAAFGSIEGGAGSLDPDTRLLGRSCLDCHTEIHGSNS